MNLIATRSGWDSDVFGCRVGILNEYGHASVSDIADLNRSLFDVVFVKSKKWIDFPGEVCGLDYLYDMELGVGEHAQSFNDVASVCSNENHVRIARTAFQDSRFLRDPRLVEHVPSMYERWVCCGGRDVYVISNTPNEGFLIDGQDLDGAFRITLVAVDENCRGTGAGKFLVTGVLGKFPGTWRVRVSARNYRAIRFYEKIGFRVKDVWTVFHVWPKDYRRL